MKLSKKDLSHIRFLASQLPKVYDGSVHTTQVTVYGETLLKNGITKVKGEDVIGDKRYVQIYQGLPVNHFNILKKFCENKQYDKAQGYINKFSQSKDEYKKEALQSK